MNLKQIKLNLFAGLFVLVYSHQIDAQHLYYLQNRLALPASQQGNSFALDASLILNPYSAGFGLQSWYCGPHKLCFSASAIQVNKLTFSDLDQATDYRFLEGGAGTYQSFGDNTWSAMGGYGRGHVHNTYIEAHQSELNLERIFLQTALCYTNHHFQAGLSFRLSRLRYISGNASVEIPDMDLEAIRIIEGKSPFYMPELGMEAGLRFRRLYTGFGTAALFASAQEVPWVKVSFSLTAGLRLN